MTLSNQTSLAALLLFASISSHALVLGVTEGVTYRASDTEIEATFAPIAKLISTATKQPVKIQIISSYNGLREALRKDQLDIAFIHPAHVSFEAIKTGAYKSVAWTTGFSDYKVSFLCKEEPIKNWASIAGKALVTPDADSITAIMTRSMLRENKLNPASDVKVQVTRFQDAVPFYVENNFASYGATASGAVIKAWKDNGGKTCAQSRGMPIKHWLVSSKMDAGQASIIKDTLLNIDKSDAGKKALATSGYKGFSVSDEATEKTLTNWLGL
ncbi:MAG: PhnD/SsuA/transferrin family substrate-binding protein [Polaromonas sp.]|nr:PhnD/SsuA/transferrin family substrate-binding protein [Polaromonas sp.]